ncbi:MAG: biopolymer transporter ExbD, partial [Gammaproteobacteria bacterium]|nr:biopolymer transporter ExbD [Gammaproteobacteria bacterium]
GKDGTVFWNDKRTTDRNELLALIEAAAVRKPQPEVHIRGDRDARYEAIGRVMYAIQRGGIVKVGFLTEPDHGVRGYR